MELYHAFERKKSKNDVGAAAAAGFGIRTESRLVCVDGFDFLAMISAEEEEEEAMLEEEEKEEGLFVFKLFLSPVVPLFCALAAADAAATFISFCLPSSLSASQSSRLAIAPVLEPLSFVTL